ncbi:cytochrome c3 family protein [Thiohalocapsa marina]|nr:cytochrome c3 family protein [Thiohalocapsa marina]
MIAWADTSDAQPSAQADQASAADGAVAKGLTSEDSAECMRCHHMRTLAYRDRETGKVVSLAIDPDRYNHSVHAELACRDCHGRGYRNYPHRTSVADEGLGCATCHSEQAEQHDGLVQLDGIKQQFKQSVHADRRPGKFSCFSCHDVHHFQPLAETATPAERIGAHNDLCLSCHVKQRGDAPAGHDWLPRVQKHWQAVRCVECHTPLEGRDGQRPSHQVLASADSNRDCVQCHSRNSALLSQLYSWRAEQQLDLTGFFGQALHNEAYIIGMSRNDTLDRISLGVLALVLLGIIAHATGRWLSYRKRVNQGGAQ